MTTHLLIKPLLRLNEFIAKAVDVLAIRENEGIHPKHYLTKYSDFFVTNITTNDRVLDIGCGNGYIASRLAEKALAVTGIDFNLERITFAQKQFSRDNLQFITGDATAYAYKENYDALVLSNVLEHIENRLDFLLRIKKLAPKLLIRVPMINRDWVVLYKKDLGLPYMSDATHYIEYTIESFADEMKSAGLRIDSYSIQFGEIWAVVTKERP